MKDLTSSNHSKVPLTYRSNEKHDDLSIWENLFKQFLAFSLFNKREKSLFSAFRNHKHYTIPDWHENAFLSTWTDL